MVTNGAARKLHTIAHRVVLVSQDIEWGLRLERLHAALRHREGVVREDDLAALLILLVHRKVDDPAEPERVLLNQVQIVPQFEPYVTRNTRRRAGFVAHEEQNVPVGHTAGLSQGDQLLLREELRNRAFDRLAVPDQIRQALGTNRLRVDPQLVKEAAGLSLDAFNGNSAHRRALLDRLSEGIEAGTTEDLRHIDDLDGDAQVRFIRPILQHRLTVRNTAERLIVHLGRRESRKQAVQDLLDDPENVLLRDVRHLHVQLVEFAGRAVRAGIFIAETRGNLEVLVEPGHHQQLLEQLGSLRQRIELAMMHAAWDQVIARAFRRTAGQDRGLEFMEPQLLHGPPQVRNHL